MSAFVLISFVGLIAPDATRSKELSESALKAAAVKQFDRAESSHVVVYAGWMGARAKPIAEAAEKAFEFAAKAIKVEKPDELFPGKIVVVMLPDRRQFGSFCLAITGKKPDSRESQEIRTRTEPPFAAISQPLGEKLADADWIQLAMASTATAVLHKKLGTDPGSFNLPDWAELGFGKLCALKAENNGSKLTAYRTKSKSLIAGRLRGAVKVTDAWAPAKGKEFDTLAMSVVEYFAFGPDPEQFIKLLNGFRQSDSNTNPTMSSVLANLEWKWEDLDSAWKIFAAKAK
jgi:hypothetical protein